MKICYNTLSELFEIARTLERDLAMNAFKSIAAAALLSVTPVIASAASVTIDDFG